MYAEVVVDVPFRRRGAKNVPAGDLEASSSDWETTFHYAIPAHFLGDVTIGQLVIVPFGATERQGIILSIADSCPIAETKDILSISDERPVLSLSHIALARWISHYYLASLPRAVALMLPPGLVRRLHVTVEAGERIPEGKLRDNEQALLALVQRKGRISIAAAKRILGASKGQAALNRLARQGYIAKRQRLGDSRVRPKIDRLARLVASDEDIMRKRLLLGRASKQADVLLVLREAGAGGLDANTVMEQAKCKDSPLKSLEERGVIVQQPAVALAISPAEAENEIIRLRGSEKHLATLDFLKREGEPVWLGWVYAQTATTLAILRDLEAHGLIRLEEEEIYRDPLAGRTFVPRTAPVLTPDQERVWEAVYQALDRERAEQFVLHGVTGSGKTEIYLRALEAVLERGRGGIVLVPEIALTPQTIARFASRFPGRVAVQHSELSAGERYDQWRQIRSRHFPVVVGTRSALFAPVPNLGLIIIDEEHDASYKQDIEPRYHARDAAAKLAEITGATLLIGSATPDVLSYARAQQGTYRLLELPQRIVVRQQSNDSRAPISALDTNGDGLPPVEVVDMREELRQGNRSIFSRALSSAVTNALDAHEQVILFLNRRGTATFVMCRDCGEVIKCTHCTVPLTYHAKGEALRCHHCNRQVPAPDYCPQCGSVRIKFFGIGTEKVAALTQEAFPNARLLRWDRDVTRDKGAHERIMAEFMNHEADILIGTQMIAKGLDLPRVTVVGVISADTALYLPDFRSGERTFQLLTQVAGRAGRSDLGGQVFIQTYTPDHYAIRAAGRHDFAAFYGEELAFRRAQGYPPYSRLARLLYTHPNEARCRQQSEALYHELRGRIARLGLPDTSLIGPAPCFLNRIKGKFRWQIVVRSGDPLALLSGMPIPPGWVVDVDPVHLL